ncbi:hypothetical protein F5Y08DRAFT_343759 [Xylaria arbuscula]|nr:hypothetical protein F5Y08DRAFT_343759 [Xylaria arbuscula]
MGRHETPHSGKANLIFTLIWKSVECSGSAGSIRIPEVANDRALPIIEEKNRICAKISHLERIAVLQGYKTNIHLEVWFFSHRTSSAHHHVLKLVVSSLGGLPLLRQLNRRYYDKPTNEPFNFDIQSASVTKYHNTWQLILTYVEHVMQWDEAYDAPCSLTHNQARAILNIQSLTWATAYNNTKNAALFDLIWSICSDVLRKNALSNRSPDLAPGIELSADH